MTYASVLPEIYLLSSAGAVALTSSAWGGARRALPAIGSTLAAAARRARVGAAFDVMVASAIAIPQAIAMGVRARRAGRGTLVCSMLLVASVLIQAPLLVIPGAGSSGNLRLWDVAWLLLLAVSLRPTVRALRTQPLRVSSLCVALWGLLSLALVAGLSLSWYVTTFGSSGLAGAAIAAFRLILVVYSTFALGVLLSRAQLRSLAYSVLSVTLVAALWGLLVFLTSTRPSAGHPATSVGVTRAGGPFGNYFGDGSADHSYVGPAASTTLGIWLLASLLVLIALLVSSPKARDPRALRIAAIGGSVVLVGALAATNSREAWVGAAVSTTLLLVALRHRLNRRYIAIAGSVVVASAVAIAVASPTIRVRVVDTFRPGTFEYRSGPQARFSAWRDGLDIASSRPLAGWGIRGVELHTPRFGRITSENLFIQTLLETGAVGLLSLIILLFGGLARLWRLMVAYPSEELVLGFGVVVGIAVEGVFGFSIRDPTILILLTIALAPLVRLGEVPREVLSG